MRNDDFDKHFKSTRRLAFGGFIVSALLSVATIVFIGWVIVKLMTHFAVL